MITLTIDDIALEAALYLAAVFNELTLEEQAVRALWEWCDERGLLGGGLDNDWLDDVNCP